MALYKSGNPALNSDTFTKVQRVKGATEIMTIKGTVYKTGLLGFIVFASAIITWHLFKTGQDINAIVPYIIGGSILGLLVAVAIIIKKPLATYLAPVYCVLEGIALGGVSALMESAYPGIVLQAISITFGILFGLLIIYLLGIIKVTENFKLIVASATLGIVLVYLFSFIGGFFNYSVPFIHDNSFWGIMVSLFIVVIAALNLVVDFDFIEEGAESKAPKFMEWYAAFGLMVTIIWLYLEILRLLGKTRKKQ